LFTVPDRFDPTKLHTKLNWSSWIESGAAITSCYDAIQLSGTHNPTGAGVYKQF